MAFPNPGGMSETVAVTLLANTEQLKKALDEIIQAETSIATKTEQLAILMQQLATAGGVSLETVAAKMKAIDAAFAGTSKSMVNAAASSVKAQQGFDNVGKSAGGLGNIMGRLEFSFIRFTVLFGVIGVLRDFITYLNEATQSALDFNQALFGFEAGVRAVQRAGLNVTIQEFSKDIDALQAKFPIFAKKDIMEGYDQILLLTRSLGLTKDQINQIVDVSATASVVLGKNFADTAMGIAKSLSSGFFESAQRAGFLISRPKVVLEGLKLGIENAKKGYDAMTEYERAIAALSTYVEQNNTIQADATRILDTQAGKVEEVAAAWTDTKLAIGQVLAPLKALGAPEVLKIAESLRQVAEGWLKVVTLVIAFSKVLGEAIGYFQILAKVAADTWNINPTKDVRTALQWILDILKAIINTAIDLVKVFGQFYSLIVSVFNSIVPVSALQRLDAFNKVIIDFIENLKSAASSKSITGFDFSSAWSKALQDAKRFTGLDTLMGDIGFKAGSKLGQGIQDGIDASLSAPEFVKLGQDIYDELTSLTNRIQQLWLDYTRKIHDIVAQANLDIANANAKYNQDVINANIDADQRRADAERQYRINEINAEAQFQEKMRQLREKFLFDLEDALRNRDARQVLRLVRQYQMDKTDAAKQEQLAYNERKRAYEEELRQIEQQRANKLRLLAEEHAAEIAQIRQNEALKIQEALTYYEREKADAEQASADRIKQQTLDFQRQYNLTDAQAKSLVNLLNGYFGVNGPVAATYRNLVSYIMALVGIARTGLAALAGFGTQIPNTIPGAGTPTPPATHAKGGTFFASKPTLAVYGDAGPEYATFTPANKLSRNQPTTQSFSANPSAGIGGMLRLLVTLSPDLRLEIKNDTLHEVSSTIEEINRKRR